jgi:hypothetical protein
MQVKINLTSDVLIKLLYNFNQFSNLIKFGLNLK